MKYYGRSQEIAQQVVDRFKSGDVAAPLKIYFLSNNNVPMNNWSWMNRFICMAAGATDARGFKQWAKVGRKVTGHSALTYILTPQIKKIRKENEDTGEEEVSEILTGFGTTAVWDVSQTHGDPLPDAEPEDHRRVLETLPLLEVAKAWGVEVRIEGVQNKGYLGYYSPSEDVIVTGVENTIVWLHELCHKADFKNGTKVETANHPTSEAVAQLSACILAHMLGMPEQADEGMTWSYISSQVDGDEHKAISLCREVLGRSCEVVNLILETATAVQPAIEIA